MLGSNIAVFIQNRGDVFIIGKILGPSLLGVYTIGYEIASTVTTELLAPIRRVHVSGLLQDLT